MDSRFYDQDQIVRLLNDKLGISCTKGTFIRYNQYGFILMPKKGTGGLGSSRRVVYHSLVPVEIATAFLLFKGDWLTLGSDERVARATILDVFLGRLQFYLSYLSADDSIPEFPFSYDFAEWFTSVRNFMPGTERYLDTIIMNSASIEDYLVQYKQTVLKPFLDSGIGPAYLRYIEDSYKITFLRIYHKIIPSQRPPRLIRRSITPPNISDKPGTSPF